MISLVQDILGAVLVVTGAAVVALAGLGVARLPDPFMRMHAATKAGTVGSGLLLLGAAVALATPGTALTAMLAIAFLVITAPVASHALGRAAYVAGAPIAAATTTNALASILDRKVFDIDPASTARKRHARAMPAGEIAMPAVPFREQPSHPEAPEAAPLRRVACWLVGGDAQRDAIGISIDLAKQAGATLTGFSAVDPDAGNCGGPVPVGGSYWARWLAERSRARMRDTAASALRDFDDLTHGQPVQVTGRHEEGDLGRLVLGLIGYDLLVLPAGVGFGGLRATPERQLAAMVAEGQIAPVLCVRQRPRGVRNILMVVNVTPGCRRLAAGLLRCGLWPSARIAVLPVAAQHPGIQTVVEEQCNLLRAHGRQVVLLDPLDPSFEASALSARIKGFDAAVMSCLSHRRGLFNALHDCPHEVVAETVPVTLLP